MKNMFVGALLLLAALCLPRAAHADTIAFQCISSGVSTDCGILESQIFADVSDTGDGVAFNFYNAGPLDSSLADIYFHDEDSKLAFSSMTPSSGVSFSVGCSPGDPPGANGFTTGFCTDSDSPVAPNGINPNEFLTIAFVLNGGFTFADVLSELGDGTLALGVHIQAFADGGSVTGISEPPPPNVVPEPASLTLFGLGLLAVGRRIYKRKTIVGGA